MESELFGYEKGAFSGAESHEAGLVRSSAHRNLFLDEIGELDSRMQAKLLRVLDGHSYFRLGGSRKVVADVRIVAATNLNLEEAVQSGKFRRDLFHRLDAFHLARASAAGTNRRYRAACEWFLREAIRRLSDEALAILEDYSWPGNIRRTQELPEQGHVERSRREIEPGDLPVELLFSAQRGARLAAQTDAPEHAYSLDGLEQQTICKVLAQTGGHQQRAADLLGISRRTLIRKLKLYRSPERGGRQGDKHLVNQLPVRKHRDDARIVA